MSAFNRKSFEESFDYPLSYASEFDVRSVFGEKTPIPKNLLDLNYETVYFAEEGENDGDSWTFFVKHRDGFYVFFEASCDFTGFDCQGGGVVIYSSDYDSMINLGIPPAIWERVDRKSLPAS